MGKKSHLIPSSWVEKRLGEVATLQRGFDLPTSTRRPGKIPVISSSGFSGTHDTAMVSAPGVVTGRYGTIGEIFWIEEDFWPLNTSLFVKEFHCNSPFFVYYLLQRVDLKKFSDKTGVPGINRNDIHKIKVLLPPIEEQKKIAEILGTWDSAIALTENLIAAKQKRKKILVQQLVIGKRRFNKFKHSWQSGVLGDLISSLDAGVSVNSEDRQKFDHEIGILKTSAVTYGTFLPKEHKAVLSSEKSRVSVSPKKDRIIISRMNTPALVGASAYIDKDYPFLFLPDRLWQVEPKHNSISMRWLSYVLDAKIIRTNISSIATGTSNSMKNISKKALLKIKILIPTFEEQQEIADFLSNIDSELDKQLNQLKLLKTQKRGLMQKLLTGEWRVKIEKAGQQLTELKT
jgi:type I restriction enzyme S subunit